jgi:uroporphyrinogen-III synthase
MQVIVTRPRLEADAWVAQLRVLHLDAVALPLIHIGAPPDSCRVDKARANLHQYRAVMFVSSNAVRYFYSSNTSIVGVFVDDVAIKNIANKMTSPRFWATGPGTREALLAQSVPAGLIDAPALDAQQFDSEALWARVQSQVKPGDRVLIVRGCSVGSQGAEGDADRVNMNGRPWLADQLTGAGVVVDFVVSYQRSAPVFDAAEQAWVAQARHDGSLWLFSSSEAVGNLMLASSSIDADWSQAKALATHPRIAQAAKNAGFGVVYESRPLLAEVAASIESLL